MNLEVLRLKIVFSIRMFTNLARVSHSNVYHFQDFYPRIWQLDFSSREWIFDFILKKGFFPLLQTKSICFRQHCTNEFFIFVLLRLWILCSYQS